MRFQDHYSSHPDAYVQYRPRYPEELYDWLAAECDEHGLAWDAGTGNGQVAVALASRFSSVVATDASAEQLAHAVPHPRVSYRREPASRSSLEAASTDLVTVGAAAHWFELEAFYAEVRRVAKPRSIVALFSYGPRDFADATHPVVHDLQEKILGDFWPERIQLVHDRYATIPFPFEEMVAPQFEMTVRWSLPETLAFFETWSASQKYFETHGTRATTLIEPQLSEWWGHPDERRVIRVPVFMRAGRI